MKNAITITGPRSVGKSTVSKLVAKRLNLKYLSSDDLGEKALKKYGGLDKAIKTGLIKKFIKKNGYNLIINQYKKNNFVFDLSVGSFTSLDFKKASRELRSIAKKKSIIVVLLPCKNKKEAIEFLYKREIKRKHFKETDKKIIFNRTKRRYPEQLEILIRNNDFIVYVKDKFPLEISKEIISKIEERHND